MHYSKMGNDSNFGMKAHIGLRAGPDLVHILIGTVSKVSDVVQVHALLHGDAVTRALKNILKNQNKTVVWQVAMKSSKRKAQPKNKVWGLTESWNTSRLACRRKLSICSMS